MNQIVLNSFRSTLLFFVFCFILGAIPTAEIYAENYSKTTEKVKTYKKLRIVNNGTCPVRIYHWVHSGDIFKTIIQPGSHWEVRNYPGEKYRAINLNHDWNNLEYDKHYMLTHDYYQTWTITPDYCSDCSGEITGFLLNKQDGSPLTDLKDGMSLCLADLPAKIKVRASESGTHESLKFTITGPSGTWMKTENYVTYDSKEFPLEEGEYTIKAELFRADHLGGTKCDEKEIKFTIRDCTIPICNLSVDLGEDLEVCKDILTLRPTIEGASTCKTNTGTSIVENTISCFAGPQNHNCPNNGYVMWLNTAANDNAQYLKNVSLEWQQFSDGTATLKGEVENCENGDRCYVDVVFSGYTTTPDEDPKDNNCQHEDKTDWYYYPTFSGTLTEIASGYSVNLTRRGPGFQAGSGANVTESRPGQFGGCAWFDTDDATFVKGDFNLSFGPLTNTDSTKNVTYLWSTGATTASIDITEPGNYCVTVTDCNSCIAEDCLKVTGINPEGGKLTFENGSLEKTICIDDTADPLNVSLTGNAGTNQAWVITDEDLNILDFPAGPPFDLNGAGTGTCLIWSVSFEDIQGAEIGKNAADLQGCFDLSNSIKVNRIEVKGGQISFDDTNTGSDEIRICADNIPTPLNVLLTGNSGTNQAWVITDENLNILGLPAAPPFDLSGAGIGTCLIWSVSFEDIEGAEIGKNAANLTGCFELSNPLKVIREQCDCPDLEANFGDACDDGDIYTFDDKIQQDCSCSGIPEQCAVSIDISKKVCNDNGTPYDKSDDTYTFDVTVFRTSGTSDSFVGEFSNAFLGIIQFGGLYNEPINLGPFPAGTFVANNTVPPTIIEDGLDIDIYVEDSDRGNICSDRLTVLSTGPCSDLVYDCPDLNANIGDNCDDGNALTINDVIDPNCNCNGVQIYDCPNLQANIGDACDDGKNSTINDLVNNDCECMGTPTEINLECSDDIKVDVIFGQGGFEVVYDDPIATSTCPTGSITFQRLTGIASGTRVFGPIEEPVTFQAIDDCGNVEVCTFNIKVTSIPSTTTIDCIDDIIVIANPGDQFTTVTWTTPTVTTDCPDGIFEFIQESGQPTSGSGFLVGTTEISYFVRDNCGNADRCVFKVTVVESFECPDLQANIGDFCDDNDATTENDLINANCECEGTPIYDCPTLAANIGDSCDDNDATTENDVVNANCECEGTPIYDCPTLAANVGDSCDDNDPTTENDVVNANCKCKGTPIYDCPTLAANIGDSCDDNDATTENDVVNANCECEGTPITPICEVTYSIDGRMITIENLDGAITSVKILDMNWSTVFSCMDWTTPCEETEKITVPECGSYFIQIQSFADWDTPICNIFELVVIDDCPPVYDCPDLQANIGDSCDDGNPFTFNDLVNSDCECKGTVEDCAVSIDIANKVCDDNDTPNDPSDDTYTFDVTVFRTGGASDMYRASYANAALGVFQFGGDYNTPIKLGPFSIDLDIDVEVSDKDRLDYSDFKTVISPGSCSTPVYDCPDLQVNIGDACDDGNNFTFNDLVNANCECEGILEDCSVSIDISNKICDDNNTPNDPSDDTYSFDVTVFRTGGASDSFTGSASNGFLGIQAFAGDYNTPINLGPFPAGTFTSSNTVPSITVLNGLDIDISVSDAARVDCSDFKTVESTGPCSVPVFDCPDLQANIGDVCDDNDPNTENDLVRPNCWCEGTPIVIYDCPNLQANIGDACNDNNPNTSNDVITADCKCEGTQITPPACEVTYSVSGKKILINGLTAPIQTVKVLDLNWETIYSCMDWDNPCEENEEIEIPVCGTYFIQIQTYFDWSTPICNIFEIVKIDDDCGTVYDCPILQANIGDACDDGNPNTENDTILSDCTCYGTPIVTFDCPTLMANIGDTCDDFNPNTENDVINANCKCKGTPIFSTDCEVTFALDGKTLTVDKIIGAMTAVKVLDSDWNEVFSCTDWTTACAETEVINIPDCGTYFLQVQTYADWNTMICNLFETIEIECDTIYDCPDLQANIGDTCDDGDPNTENDLVRPNCWCEGTPIVIYDCPDLQANIGNACDDGNANTENDQIQNDCSCAGTPIQPCDNLTNGGSIEGDETGCEGYDPAPITSPILPSGGSGAIEYIWLSSTTGCPNRLEQMIPGANESTYDPGPITQTTYFRRCARRAGCAENIDWLAGESNCVVKAVDICKTVCEGRKITDTKASCGNGLHYGFYASDLVQGANNNSRFSLDDADFIEYNDGTAKLKGTAVNCQDTTVKFDLDVTFLGRTLANNGTIESNCYHNDETDWYFYTIFYGTADGLDAVAGAKFNLANNGQAFQIGTGANLQEEFSLGAAAWFSYTVISQPTNPNITLLGGAQTDFNFNLSGDAELPCDSISTRSQILGLDAALNQGIVDITWTNNTGEENDNFEIQRSEDGVNFETIQTRSSLGNGVKFYETKDPNALEGANFYRVKLNYLNGNVDYSETRRVHISEVQNFGLFPNPAQEHINVSLRSYEGKDIEIQLIDQFGKRIKSVSLDYVSDSTYSIDLDGMNNGIYHLWIFAEGTKPVGKKMIVNKMY